MAKDNTIFIVIGVLIVIFLLQGGKIPETFAVSELTGSNVIPRNIQFVNSDGVIILDGNILEFELLDSSNPQCAGSSLSINQERVKLDGKGYRCKTIPGNCNDGETGGVPCGLQTCGFSIELSNELEPGIYEVNVDIGTQASQSSFCTRRTFSSLTANFKIGITGIGYNLVDNECILFEGIPEFNTLSECEENIIEEIPVEEESDEEVPDEVSEEFCGDGICNAQESYSNCRTDCVLGEMPIVTEPTVEVTEESFIEENTGLIIGGIITAIALLFI